MLTLGDSLARKGQFFSTKLSGCHIGTSQSSLEHSEVVWGVFKKSHFFLWTPYRLFSNDTGLMSDVTTLDGLLASHARISGFTTPVVPTNIIPALYIVVRAIYRIRHIIGQPRFLKPFPLAPFVHLCIASILSAFNLTIYRRVQLNSPKRLPRYYVIPASIPQAHASLVDLVSWNNPMKLRQLKY